MDNYTRQQLGEVLGALLQLFFLLAFVGLFVFFMVKIVLFSWTGHF